jgi:hypothetical protein
MEIHIEEKDIRAIGENPRLLRAFADMIIKASQIDFDKPIEMQLDIPCEDEKYISLSAQNIFALKSDRGGFCGAPLKILEIETANNSGWVERSIGKKVLKTDYEKALSLRNKKHGR